MPAENLIGRLIGALQSGFKRCEDECVPLGSWQRACMLDAAFVAFSDEIVALRARTATLDRKEA